MEGYAQDNMAANEAGVQTEDETADAVERWRGRSPRFPCGLDARRKKQGKVPWSSRPVDAAPDGGALGGVGGLLVAQKPDPEQQYFGCILHLFPVPATVNVDFVLVCSLFLAPPPSC